MNKSFVKGFSDEFLFGRDEATLEDFITAMDSLMSCVLGNATPTFEVKDGTLVAMMLDNLPPSIDGGYSVADLWEAWPCNAVDLANDK